MNTVGQREILTQRFIWVRIVGIMVQVGLLLCCGLSPAGAQEQEEMLPETPAVTHFLDIPALWMPDVIRHPESGGVGLDSCLRRNDERLHRIVICSRFIGSPLPWYG